MRTVGKLTFREGLGFRVEGYEVDKLTFWDIGRGELSRPDMIHIKSKP